MHSKKGLSLVLLTAVISGFSIFLNKFGVTGMNPFVFTFLKNSVVAVFLFSVLMLAKDLKNLAKLTKKQWTKLVLIGLFGGSIPFLLFFKGLQLTSAASGSFIHKTMFIWVAVLALIFLKQKLDKKILIPAGLLLVGNFLLLQLTSFTIGTGEIMIFVATLLWGFETILSKSVLKSLDGKTVAFGRMFFGSLFILMFLFVTGNVTAIATLSFTQIGWVLFTSLLLFGYVFTWYNGLKIVSPVVATSILLLGSPITTLLNFVFLDKLISPIQIVGMVLLVAGALSIVLLEKTHTISIANPR